MKTTVAFVLLVLGLVAEAPAQQGGWPHSFERKLERMLAAMEDPAEKERAASLLATIQKAENAGSARPAVSELLSLQEPAAVITGMLLGKTQVDLREAAIARLRLQIRDLSFLLDWMVEDARGPGYEFGSAEVVAGPAWFLELMAGQANKALGTHGTLVEVLALPRKNFLESYSRDSIKRWIGIQLASALTSSGWSEEERRTLEELQRKFPAGSPGADPKAGSTKPGDAASHAAPGPSAVAAAPVPPRLLWSAAGVVLVALAWVLIRRKPAA